MDQAKRHKPSSYIPLNDVTDFYSAFSHAQITDFTLSTGQNADIMRLTAEPPIEHQHQAVSAMRAASTRTLDLSPSATAMVVANPRSYTEEYTFNDLFSDGVAEDFTLEDVAESVAAPNTT